MPFYLKRSGTLLASVRTTATKNWGKKRVQQAESKLKHNIIQ